MLLRRFEQRERRARRRRDLVDRRRLGRRGGGGRKALGEVGTPAPARGGEVLESAPAVDERERLQRHGRPVRVCVSARARALGISGNGRVSDEEVSKAEQCNAMHCVCVCERAREQASERAREGETEWLRQCVCVRACVRPNRDSPPQFSPPQENQTNKQTQPTAAPARPPLTCGGESGHAFGRGTTSGVAPRAAASACCSAAVVRSGGASVVGGSGGASGAAGASRAATYVWAGTTYTYVRCKERVQRQVLCARARACVCVRVCVCVWVSIYALPLGHEDGSPERRVGFSVLVAGNRGCLAVRDTLGVL